MDGIQGLLSDLSQLFDTKKNEKLGATKDGLLSMKDNLKKAFPAPPADYHDREAMDQWASSNPLSGIGTGNLGAAGGLMGAMREIKNPNTRLLNSMANMVKNESGTYVPHVAKYDTIPPFEAYDIHKKGSGLLIKDIAPNKTTLAHDMVGDKVAGASLLENVQEPHSLLMQYLQHFPSLSAMSKGTHPLNTEMGQWASDAVNKLGGLLTDLKVSPNSAKDYPVVGKLDDLVNQHGVDPNDQARLLAYIKSTNPHLLNYQGGTNIYKGANLTGNPKYPPAGLDTGKQLQEWFNDNLTENARKNMGPLSQKDLVLQYLWKHQGSIDPELF